MLYGEEAEGRLGSWGFGVLGVLEFFGVSRKGFLGLSIDQFIGTL